MRKLARSLYLGAIALVFAVPVANAAGNCIKRGDRLTVCRDGSFAIEVARNVFRVYEDKGRVVRICGKGPEGLKCSRAFLVPSVQDH